jgi:DNA invertase Pin-like site-specific DNA recombinase
MQLPYIDCAKTSLYAHLPKRLELVQKEPKKCCKIYVRNIKCCESANALFTNTENMMIFGYARTSTEKQNLELQIDALKQAGVDDISLYKEQLSGSQKERPQLKKLLEQLRKGDTLVVWKLDRLARSMNDLLSMTEEFHKKGIELKSITENIDTTSPMGQFAFHLLGALGQFERELIKERINAGIANAKAQGKKLGRPRSLTTEQIDLVKEMRKKGRGVTEIARIMKCSRYSVYRVLG